MFGRNLIRLRHGTPGTYGDRLIANLNQLIIIPTQATALLTQATVLLKSNNQSIIFAMKRSGLIALIVKHLGNVEHAMATAGIGEACLVPQNYYVRIARVTIMEYALIVTEKGKELKLEP